MHGSEGDGVIIKRLTRALGGALSCHGDGWSHNNATVWFLWLSLYSSVDVTGYKMCDLQYLNVNTIIMFVIQVPY